MGWQVRGSLYHKERKSMPVGFSSRINNADGDFTILKMTFFFNWLGENVHEYFFISPCFSLEARGCITQLLLIRNTHFNLPTLKAAKNNRIQYTPTMKMTTCFSVILIKIFIAIFQLVK